MLQYELFCFCCEQDVLNFRFNNPFVKDEDEPILVLFSEMVKMDRKVLYLRYFNEKHPNFTSAYIVIDWASNQIIGESQESFEHENDIYRSDAAEIIRTFRRNMIKPVENVVVTAENVG